MIADPKAHEDFLQHYAKWAGEVLTPARHKLRSVLDQWRVAEHWKRYNAFTKQPAPTPIHRSTSRIKRPESAADKILRKPETFPDGLSLESIKKLPDALAGRVITYFLAGLPLVHKELTNHPLFDICETPTAYLEDSLLRRLGLSELKCDHKESGYSSIHYLLRFKPGILDGDHSPIIEIQVRTLTLDTWGEIEHVLGYKPHKRTSFAVQKQFQIIASQLAAIDQHFNFLYEEQTRYRDEKIIESSDPLNAENFPALLARYGLGCSQHEIDGLLKLLASRTVVTVDDFVKSATHEKIEIIQNTYRSHEGRAPIDFEVVANIGATARITDPMVIQRMVQAQIDFLKTWESLKKQSARR